MPVAPAIGIDLGTTYSCVGVKEGKKVTIISNDQGNKTTPSYVAFRRNGHLVGEVAKIHFPVSDTVYDAKRLIGRTFNDPAVQDRIQHWPFTLVEENGKLKIQVNHLGEQKTFFPEEISALVLMKIKEIAEAHIGMEVENAVITVPAYFKNSQRQATKYAGAIAKLNVMRIINEPTAAALAYSFDKKEATEKKLLIFDLGGGTFDVSVLLIEEGIIEILSVNGNSLLGGEDFDTRVVNYFVQEINRKFGKNVMDDKKALRRLRNACERMKRTLSTETETTIELEDLMGIDYQECFTRSKFEELNEDLFKATIEPVQLALTDAGLNKTEIDEVILVGGSTRIPKVRELVREFFNGKELNTSINPDEAVAYGAALQAAILHDEQSEELKDRLLMDVTPLSLGIETVGGAMSTLIPRNSPIPVKKTKHYTTVRDNQRTVNIQVYEGERQLTKHNSLIGKFKLCDIPRARCGAPQIDVTFYFDVDSLLNVSAVEKSTNIIKDITITCESGNLSKEDVDKLIKKADECRREELRMKATVQARGNLEYYCHNMKARVEDKTKNVPLASKQAVLNKCQEISQWLYSNDDASKAECDSKMKELEDICSKIPDL